MGKKKAAAAVQSKAVPGEIIGEANGLPLRRIKVSEIDGAHYNPREITERALGGLKASVDHFKLVQPLVWNIRFQRLVGGHQRVKTLDPNSTTDVIQVDLDEVDEKALNAQLNNRAIQGDWTANVSELLDEIEAARPEMFTRLALDDLRVEIPTLHIGDEGGDDIPDTDDKPSTKHTCPSCGTRF